MLKLLIINSLTYYLARDSLLAVKDKLFLVIQDLPQAISGFTILCVGGYYW